MAEKKAATTMFSFSNEVRNEMGQSYKILLKNGEKQICPNNPQPLQNSLGTITWAYPYCNTACPFFREQQVKISASSDMSMAGIVLLCQKVPATGILEKK